MLDFPSSPSRPTVLKPGRTRAKRKHRRQLLQRGGNGKISEKASVGEVSELRAGATSTTTFILTGRYVCKRPGASTWTACGARSSVSKRRRGRPHVGLIVAPAGYRRFCACLARVGEDAGVRVLVCMWR